MRDVELLFGVGGQSKPNRCAESVRLVPLSGSIYAAHGDCAGPRYIQPSCDRQILGPPLRLRGKYRVADVDGSELWKAWKLEVLNATLMAANELNQLG